MRLFLSSIIALVGTSVCLATHHHPFASNFNHLNPVKATLQTGDIHPASYIQTLNVKRRLGKKLRAKRNHKKRDYATTLQYLRAAINSYKKSLTTPPPAKLVELAQQLSPPPSPPAPAVEPPRTEFRTQPPPPQAPEVVSPPNLEAADPPSPDLETAAVVEPGNQTTESTVPVNADIEDDDKFDPEEDPDDVDDPPVVNGVAVSREE